MSPEDIETRKDQLRRIRRIKSEVSQLPVVKLKSYRNVYEIEKEISKTLEGKEKG